MDHAAKLQTFADMLTAELASGLRHVADIKWETHTAFVVYCADLANMAWAANSEEQIEATGCDAMISTDWARIGGGTVADYLSRWQDDWYDDESGDTFDWDAEVVKAVISSIKLVQELGIHTADNFSDQFLWGLQFTDPCSDQIATMLAVSEAVNTGVVHHHLQRALSPAG